MPRSRGGSGGGRRPVPAAPQRPAAPKQPARPASTAAHPPATAQQNPPPAAAQQSSGSGLFGQMASTAMGVAVGSSIGHAVGGMFGGSSSTPAAEQAPADNSLAAQSNQTAQDNAWGARSCEGDAKSFTQCLDDNQGNMQICGWYLNQLKACQQAASQY